MKSYLSECRYFILKYILCHIVDSSNGMSLKVAISSCIYVMKRFAK